MTSGVRLATVGILTASSVGLAQVPRELWREPPNVPLVTSERIAKYVPTAKAEWEAYLVRSRELRTRDTASMRKELRAARATKMTQAPYTHDFALTDSMTAAWFATDTARRIADNILTYQAPNGGWSKHVDFRAHARRPAESYFGESDQWEWISTIDNFSTTEEIRFLTRTNAARRDPRYEAAVSRGVGYLLSAQYPNGCFPQVYPLQGGYHDAATYNDDATIHVLAVLRETARGAFSFVSDADRRRAERAVVKGIDCILASQVRVNGALTAWGQQHDPLMLAPISARTYELESLAALESASIVDFLMTIDRPDERIVRAVDAAVNWLKAVPLRGYSYAHYELKAASGAGPLWGRLYEIGTNRVIMANRDGVKRYDWNELTDRRSGYRWYVTEPARTIAEHDGWKKRVER